VVEAYQLVGALAADGIMGGSHTVANVLVMIAVVLGATCSTCWSITFPWLIVCYGTRERRLCTTVAYCE
jgi:hypothetical protein